MIMINAQEFHTNNLISHNPSEVNNIYKSTYKINYIFNILDYILYIFIFLYVLFMICVIYLFY